MYISFRNSPVSEWIIEGSTESGGTSEEVSVTVQVRNERGPGRVMVVEVERKTFGRTAGIKAKGLQSPGNSCPVGKQEKKQQVFGEDSSDLGMLSFWFLQFIWDTDVL